MFNTLVVIKQPAARMKFMFQNSYVTLEHLVWLLFPYYVFRCPCVLSVIEVILKLSTLFNRTNNIHIWQRLCHEDWCTWSSRLLLSDHYNNAASQLYVRVKILLACEKHVHDHIILQTGGILARPWPYHFTNRGYFGLFNINPATLYWSACTKSGK